MVDVAQTEEGHHLGYRGGMLCHLDRVDRLREYRELSRVYCVSQVVDRLEDKKRLAMLQGNAGKAKHFQDCDNVHEVALHVGEKILTSYMYRRAYYYITLVKITSIKCLNVPGEFFNPNGIRLKRYILWCKVN